MYVRVASPRYAAANFFCRRLSSVTPPYRIFPLCCVNSCSQLIGRVNFDGNTGIFGIVIINRYKLILTFYSTEAVFYVYINFYVDYLPTSQMMTRHQTKCGRHDAVRTTLPPSSSSSSSSRQGHVRLPYPLHTAASFCCHS